MEGGRRSLGEETGSVGCGLMQGTICAISEKTPAIFGMHEWEQKFRQVSFQSLNQTSPSKPKPVYPKMIFTCIIRILQIPNLCYLDCMPMEH